jgi:hypothetical protein
MIETLKRSWWVIFPAFAALTVRLAAERSCGDPYDLLPVATSNPALAWPLAIVYVLAHAWIAGAYLATAERSRSLVPPITVWTSSANPFQILLMLAAFAVEYAPAALWASLGAMVGCR